MPTITVLAPRGLGDAVVCLPSCYELVRQGHTVNLLNAGRTNWVEHLPTLLQIGTEREGEIRDCSHSLDYYTDLRMVAAVAMRLNVMPPLIQEPPWLYRPELTIEGLPEGYIVVVPRGSQDYKAFSAEQVQPLADEWPIVVVHDKPLPEMPGVNLTGQTTPEELFGVLANARAVVSVDTGSLHVAGAMGVPLLAVAGGTINALSFCSDYTPSLWLTCQRSELVPGKRIAEGLRALIEEHEL